MVVRRRMPAPREVVFEAWIDPKGIHEWMCPGDVVSAEATLMSEWVARSGSS
jgi:uncharacterized protein YndB with AHSA1/START domain